MTTNERRPFVEKPPFKSVGRNKILDAETGWSFDYDSRESTNQIANVLVITPEGAICYIKLRKVRESADQDGSSLYMASKEQIRSAFKVYKSQTHRQLPTHFNDSWLEERISYLLDGCGALLDYRSWPLPKPAIVVCD